MSHPSIPQQQGFYRYDPTLLQSEPDQAGPARIFPHRGNDGTLIYILNRLGQNLVDQGQLSPPLMLLLENLEVLSKKADEAWITLATILVNLEVFQSDWFNFTLPPGEQFNADFVRLRKEMGATLKSAIKEAEANSDSIESQRLAFYKVLENRGRTQPSLAKIHERDGELSDREFARQRLAGPNPISLYRVQDRTTLNGLDSVQFNGESVSLIDAASQNKLFAVDYPLLNLAPADLQDGRYVGNPKALFYHSDRGLEPLLIQLEKGGNVYTPADSDDWMRAKLYVQVADVTQHELITHLCFTHLAMEAFAIATPRQLPGSHPVSRLLRPHFKFLLAINTRGNAILLSEGAAIDKLMAPTREVSLSMINRAYRERPFHSHALPKDLEHRGVGKDVLSDYPYRDDAQLLWQAIERYATRYLQQYYSSDEAVQQDVHLQVWAAELGAPLAARSVQEFAQAPGWIPDSIADGVGLSVNELPNYPRVPDFPNPKNPGEIKTVQQLIDVATQVIFTCSAQHAAVNFSQFDYFGYVPNAPMAAYTRPDVPATLEQMLPAAEQDLDQMELVFALSGIIWSRLGSSEIIQFKDQGDRHILQAFQTDLQEIETTIAERNRQRVKETDIDYPYFLPSRIPNSINI